MVSQPDSRQVSGKRSPNAGGTSSDSGSGEDSKKTTTSSSPDGYAADWESLASKNVTSSRPPEELHFRHHHHHHHQHHRSHHHTATADKTRSHPNPCASDESTIAAKRQKVLEAQFAAHIAIKDIEAAGLPIPELRPDRPRAISFATVDVSRVNFFFSSQLMSNQVSDGSGSLIDAIRAKAKEQKLVQATSKTSNSTSANTDLIMEEKKRSIFMEDERVYKDMLQTTAAFYRSTTSMACFETESNTSSVSDTESDDANMASTMRPITAASCCSDKIILAAPTRHESSLSKPTTTKPETSSKPAASSKAASKPVNPSLPPSAMTMGDALNFSQHGRLVVASTAPFRVIFANAAVAGIHGRPCHEISGQTLSRLLVLTKTTAKFRASFGEERIVDLRKHSGTKSKERSEEHVSCLMKISPIVSDLSPSTNGSDSKACITHLCVDLIPQESSNLSSADMLVQPERYQAASSNYQQHSQVMG